ncbi:MAG: sulfite exporter TauE/SafE family protein [Terracidiphilus sp.]
MALEFSGVGHEAAWTIHGSAALAGHDLRWKRGPGLRSLPRPWRVLMTWMMLLVGVVVGMVSGVVGIGGGILFVPALVWLLGMDQHKAQGTSLGALLLPVGAFAFFEYYRKGNADIRVALLLAAGFLVGGYFGAAGAQFIPELWLRRIFALTLIAVGGRMWFSR